MLSICCSYICYSICCLCVFYYNNTVVIFKLQKQYMLLSITLQKTKLNAGTSSCHVCNDINDAYMAVKINSICRPTSIKVYMFKSYVCKLTNNYYNTRYSYDMLRLHVVVLVRNLKVVNANHHITN